jgi:hypothetical protein
LMIIYLEYGQANGCRVKREQLREVQALKEGRKLVRCRKRKMQMAQRYHIPFLEKDW